MNLLSWYVLLYISSIVVGVVVCLGSILTGSVEGDADADVEADADGDAHGDVEGPMAWVLYALGSGSVPTGLALAISTLVFGTAGLLSSRLLSSYLSSGWVGLSSLLLAVGSIFLVGRRICLLIGRWFPTHEHHSVTSESLVGSSGEAVGDLALEGHVGVYDDAGSYHVLKARAIEEPIRKGARVMVAGYDPESGVHSVVREPQ